VLPAHPSSAFDVAAGQAVNGTMSFTGTVTKVLFCGWGFVVDASGAPARYPSEASATWNVGG